MLAWSTYGRMGAAVPEVVARRGERAGAVVGAVPVPTGWVPRSVPGAAVPGAVVPGA